MAWAPLQHAPLLAIGTSGGGVLCFDAALHSLQVPLTGRSPVVVHIIPFLLWAAAACAAAGCMFIGGGLLCFHAALVCLHVPCTAPASAGVLLSATQSQVWHCHAATRIAAGH